jgi:hypothetical protein
VTIVFVVVVLGRRAFDEIQLFLYPLDLLGPLDSLPLEVQTPGLLDYFCARVLEIILELYARVAGLASVISRTVFEVFDIGVEIMRPLPPARGFLMVIFRVQILITIESQFLNPGQANFARLFVAFILFLAEFSLLSTF